MPRKKIEKILPRQKSLEKIKILKVLGGEIYNKKNWYINKSTISKAVFIGLFVCFIPVPFQMVISGFLALYFGANLPLSIGLVWITNPITMPVIMSLEYYVGGFLLGVKMKEVELNLDWFDKNMDLIFSSLYFGSFVLALFFSFSGFYLTKFLWHNEVKKKHKRKKEKGK